MKLPVNVAQSMAGHMGVDFRGIDARVAEQFLNDAQVGSALQQMRGKAVTEHVRRDIARDPAPLRPRLDSFPQRDS
jgi:hypothetical protein